MEFAPNPLPPLPAPQPRNAATAVILYVIEFDHFRIFRLTGRSVRMPLIFRMRTITSSWFDDACLPGRMLCQHQAIPMG